jgi:hypothetical protein
MDRSIAAARKAEPLYSEANTIRRQLDNLTSGRTAAQAAAAQTRAERVRQAKVGDTVIDSAFGLATSARAQLRALNAEIATADANVIRATNHPQDSQDFHRAYMALRTARSTRDQFLASLSADMRNKVAAGGTKATRGASAQSAQSAPAATTSTRRPRAKKSV